METKPTKSERREQAKLKARERQQKKRLRDGKERDAKRAAESVTTSVTETVTEPVEVPPTPPEIPLAPNVTLPTIPEPLPVVPAEAPEVTRVTLLPPEPRVSRVSRIAEGLRSTVLVGSALALFGTGVVINGWYAQSLGSTDFAGKLFLAVGGAADIAALVLPSQALALWSRSRWRSLGTWGLWSLTFAFALSASLGFASVNIADTRTHRSVEAIETPAVRAARDALADARKSFDKIDGKRFSALSRADKLVGQRNTELSAALKADKPAADAISDPQSEGASKLIQWLTSYKPSADDFSEWRLLLLTVLPQTGGLILAAARR